MTTDNTTPRRYPRPGRSAAPAALGDGFRDEIVKSLYAEAERIARRAVQAKRRQTNATSTSASTAWSPRRSSACRSC